MLKISEANQIVIKYPRELKDDEEETLISYFQVYTRKMEAAFKNGGRTLSTLGKKEMGKVFSFASKHITTFIRLEKQGGGEYVFQVDKSILGAIDLPEMPKRVRKMLLGGHEDLWDRLEYRIRADLKGDVAKKIGMDPELL